MSADILVTLDGHVLRLTLARVDKKNALTSAMYATLIAQLERAESDPDIHVVLFEAEGGTFCAGNDLNDFAAVARGTVQASELKAYGFIQMLARATKPYVAAVQGAAIGIGTTLLLHCDLVYVAEDATLSTPFVNLALVPEAASSLLLPARVGHVRAYAMFALGELIDGRTAADLGLANAAVPASEVRTRAFAAASELARRPLGALQATKRLMRDAQAIQATMDREVQVFAERLKSPEALAAIRRFMEGKG